MSKLSPAVRQRKKWYSTARWKRLRKRVLAGSPLCSICHRVPASQADHVEHLPDNSTFWKLENLRPACAECNNRAGAKARHARTPEGGLVASSTWGAHTALGGTENYTGDAKASRLDGLFQRLKGGTNAESDD